MDILNDIFETLDLRGTLYFRTDFSPPWSVTVPELGAAARFHLVLQGICNVTLPSGETIELMPGDLILIPKGKSHILADKPGRPAPQLEDVLQAVGYDGNGVLTVGDGNPDASTQMLCGHFTFRDQAEHPLLTALPDVLVTTSSIRARHVLLDELLRLVARKIFSNDLGSSASVIRLSETIFIELLRIGVEQSSDLKSIVDAICDPQIGKAISLMHNAPASRWTVESLAREVGMSRSRFAERFAELLNMGPMSYLSDWRLQCALPLLEKQNASVQEIAGKTGYQSPAAFSRAFAGKFGVAPREYRRHMA